MKFSDIYWNIIIDRWVERKLDSLKESSIMHFGGANGLGSSLLKFTSGRKWKVWNSIEQTIITGNQISKITNMTILIIGGTMVFAFRVEMWPCATNLLASGIIMSQ